MPTMPMQQTPMGAMGSGPGGQLTDEERLYWLENMPAITKQESDIEQAKAISNQLRGGMRGTRMDWASQAARGIEGIGSGMADRRVAQGIGKLDADRAAFGQGYADMIRRRQRGSVPPMATPGFVPPTGRPLTDENDWMG